MSDRRSGRIVGYLAGGTVVAGAVAVAAYMAYRPKLLTWGATEDELARSWPGDDVVPDPKWSFTHAVTIHAPAAAIWPWIVQWGYGRGGFYSYDWIDRMMGVEGLKSADRILPEFQHLAVGDTISLAPGLDLPVVLLEPERALVIEAEGQPNDPGAPPDPTAPGYMHMGWAWLLVEQPDGTTRLISRARLDYPPSAANDLMHAFVQVGSFVMDRGMLEGIKRRVEASRPA